MAKPSHLLYISGGATLTPVLYSFTFLTRACFRRLPSTPESRCRSKFSEKGPKMSPQTGPKEVDQKFRSIYVIPSVRHRGLTLRPRGHVHDACWQERCVCNKAQCLSQARGLSQEFAGWDRSKPGKNVPSDFGSDFARATTCMCSRIARRTPINKVSTATGLGPLLAKFILFFHFLMA